MINSLPEQTPHRGFVHIKVDNSLENKTLYGLQEGHSTYTNIYLGKDLSRERVNIRDNNSKYY